MAPARSAGCDVAKHERAKRVGADGGPVRRSWARRIVLAFVAVPLGLLVGSVAGVFGQSYDWRTAPAPPTELRTDGTV